MRKQLRKITTGLLAFALVTGTLPAGISNVLPDTGAVVSAATPVTIKDEWKPKAVTGLGYTGDELTLVNAPTALPDGYSIQYKVGTGEWSRTATAVNAGTYTVKVRYVPSATSDDIVAGDDITVTVAKMVAPLTVTAKAGLVYNGNEQVLVTESANVTDGYTAQYSTDDGKTWSADLPTGTDAGKYSVKYKFVTEEEGKEDTAEKDLTIEIAKMKAPELTDAQKPTAKEKLAYTGEDQELITAPASAVDGWTIKFAAGTDDLAEDIPTGKDAGSYTVKVVYEGDDNHETFNGASLKVDIAKAEAPETLANSQRPTTAKGLAYTGEAQDLIVPAAEPVEGYTVKYSADGGNTWSEKIPTGTDAGEYTTKVRFVGDKNHKDFDSAALITTINPAGAQLVMYSKNGLTYTGEPQVLAELKGYDPGEGYSIKYKVVTYEDYRTTYEYNERRIIEDTTVAAADSATATDVGEYLVVAYFEGDANHKTDWYLWARKVTIAPAALTLTDAQKPTAVEGLIVNDKDQELVKAPEEKVEHYTIQYAIGADEFSDKIPTGKDVGTYTVNWKYVGENENYADTAAESIEVTIAPQETWTSPIAKSGLVYTGEAQELVTPPNTSAGAYTVMYSLDGETWAKEVPTGTDAGDYTVKIKYQGDGNHEDFTGEELKVTIAKATVDSVDPAQMPTAADGLVYTGEAQELVIAPDEAPAGYTISYAVGEGEFSEEIPTGTDVGEYTIKVKFEGDDNHEGFDGKDLLAVIGKASAPELTDAQKPTAKEGLKFTGNAQELVNAPEAAPEGYTVQYSLDGTTWSEDIPTGTADGEYTVKVKYVADENHVDFDGEDIKVTIADAVKLTLAKPEIKIAFGGRTVQLNCSDPDAEIYYNFGSSNITTECQHVKAGETIFVDTPRTGKDAFMCYKAYKDGEWSELGKWGVLNVKIDQPIIRQSGNKDSETFRIYTQAKNSYIVYTVDGTDPSIVEGSQQLTIKNGNIIWATDGKITVKKGQTVKAIAVRSGLVTSDVLTYTFE